MDRQFVAALNPGLLATVPSYYSGMVANGARAVLRARMARLIDEVESTLPSSDRERLQRQRAILDAPVRIALVGRVNAGKSTLVNALIGQRAAPTNATECTRIATVYRYGMPARVEVFGLDGTERSISVHDRVPDELGIDPEHVDHAVAYLPSAQLRTAELIDSPGLGTLSRDNAAATERAVGRRQSNGLGPVDSFLFLCDSAPRLDEVEFLSSLGANESNTLMLLSHADNFGSGAFGDVDPFEDASRQASRIGERLASVVGEVLPVSGLLAETAATGGFTESDARSLAALAPIDTFDLLDILTGVDTTRDRSSVERLLRLVGEYGVLHGRHVAGRGAGATATWMRQRSGVDALRERFGREHAGADYVRRVRVVLSELRSIADVSYGATALIDAAEREPDLHPLRELTALELIERWKSDHRLVAELKVVVGARDDRSALGLSDDVVRTEVSSRAVGLCSMRHNERMSVFSAAEREVLTVLERSYLLIAQRNR